MSPYLVQIDLLYFHIMEGFFLKGRQISSLSFSLQKHESVKKSIPPIRQDSWISSPLIFCLYQNEVRGGGQG